MGERSVIVIGAGLAGLATGCYARMNGYRSTIFEKHYKPGGVATCWTRRDYLVDGGIHFLMGYRPGQIIYDLYRELGVIPSVRVADLATYGPFTDESTGARITLTPDLDRLAQDLKALAPKDGAVIDGFIAGARAMQRFDMGESMSEEPALSGTLGKVKQMWRMRSILKYFGGRFGKPVREYARSIQDPWVRWVFENLFLPDVPVWFVLMIVALLADRQMGLLKDGSLAFVSAIEKRYKDLGGEVVYDAGVEKILVKNDKAVGVRLEDDSEHLADFVVSAADGHSTIFEMLDGQYLDETIESRYKNWRLFGSAAIVSFGVNRRFDDESWMNVIKLQRPLEIGGRSVPGFIVRIFNYSDRFAPPGKTVVQVMLEAEWEYWSELQNDRPRYDAEKKRLAEELLARLEPHYPGISSRVEMTDVATPYTWWRYTGNYQGSFEGWLPTSQAIRTPVKKTLPGLDNFFMAGQWVTPGGGVPPCLYSGRHVAKLLCRKDKKPFFSAAP